MKKRGIAIGQYGLYTATSGSNPISPIPISIPTTQILDFVIVSDTSTTLYGNYYNHSQHVLLEIESFFNLSAVELISHNQISEDCKIFLLRETVRN
jgi:hypothetical protein